MEELTANKSPRPKYLGKSKHFVPYFQSIINQCSNGSSCLSEFRVFFSLKIEIFVSIKVSTVLLVAIEQFRFMSRRKAAAPITLLPFVKTEIATCVSAWVWIYVPRDIENTYGLLALEAGSRSILICSQLGRHSELYGENCNKIWVWWIEFLSLPQDSSVASVNWCCP